MQKILPLVFILSIAGLRSSGQCNPAFTSSVNQAIAQFHATSTNPGLRHTWYFDDGSQNGYGINIAHSYSQSGTYTVKHYVTDSLNTCSDSLTQQVTINIPVTCSAGFTVTRDSIFLNQFYFHSTSQVSSGTIQLYSWTIDGVPINAASTFSTLLSPGTHTVCLTINTTAGCTSSTCQTMVVDTTTCTWTASFTHTASATNPKQISFVANPSSNALRYYWNFGDGHTSSQTNPVHTYNQVGTYTVRLAIVDTFTGCYDTVLQQLQVHGLPADSCTASYTYTVNPAIPNQLTFTASSNQTITSQTWIFNHWVNPFYDSIGITANNPTYTFMDTGYYYSCLFITTNTGCSNWFCWGIYIDSIGGQVAGRVPSYPNPARSVVNFRLNLTEANRIGITVYNTSGYIVYKTLKQGNTGSNEINIPVEQLNPGQYFIDIQYGDQRKRSIFQKF